jgi:hypothetical protein
MHGLKNTISLKQRNMSWIATKNLKHSSTTNRGNRRGTTKVPFLHLDVLRLIRVAKNFQNYIDKSRFIWYTLFTVKEAKAHLDNKDEMRIFENDQV